MPNSQERQPRVGDIFEHGNRMWEVTEGGYSVFGVRDLRTGFKTLYPEFKVTEMVAKHKQGIAELDDMWRNAINKEPSGE